ncbi:uncharacterized protein il11b isoform X2 [Denticeps clupeoides]|uniref:uncharacterized protein il11b isoform X2 n=1 Tax=Denticeps clupeoides TaxID=299321 RepID=UPI0010A3B803|nr:uncharacterized protein LOC114770123 isoform X2 [Denticeps clupeoides]
MKLLHYTSVILHCWLLLVLLRVASFARPSHHSSQRENLRKIYHQMQMLKMLAPGSLSREDLSTNYEHNLASLPSMHYRASDMMTLQLNRTLLHLFSGLQSFKFHLDWLREGYHNSSQPVGHRTEQILSLLTVISNLVKSQMEDPPSWSHHPSLPALHSAWDLHVSSVVIHQQLQLFCNWSLHTLYSLLRKAVP